MEGQTGNEGYGLYLDWKKRFRHTASTYTFQSTHAHPGLAPRDLTYTNKLSINHESCMKDHGGILCTILGSRIVA